MTPNPELNYTGVPVVMLGGKEWLIPLLAVRQHRIVDPGLIRMLPHFAMLNSALKTGDGNVAINGFSTEQYDDLITIVHTSLWRAYPGLTKDAFLDMEITRDELVKAYSVILNQSGLFVPAGAQPAGEPNGPVLPISTGS